MRVPFTLSMMLGAPLCAASIATAQTPPTPAARPDLYPEAQHTYSIAPKEMHENYATLKSDLDSKGWARISDGNPSEPHGYFDLKPEQSQDGTPDGNLCLYQVVDVGNGNWLISKLDSGAYKPAFQCGGSSDELTFASMLFSVRNELGHRIPLATTLDTYSGDKILYTIDIGQLTRSDGLDIKFTSNIDGTQHEVIAPVSDEAPQPTTPNNTRATQNVASPSHKGGGFFGWLVAAVILIGLPIGGLIAWRRSVQTRSFVAYLRERWKKSR